MTGAALLAKALKDAGVKYLVGYTGGAIMPFFDEMIKHPEFKFIMSRHEQGSAFTAQGISRASINSNIPQVGVCLTTSGPGATNLTTGVADAYMDSVPIIGITGQVATSVIGTDAFQETDIVGVMLPITKQAYMPITPEEVEETFHEAKHIATHGRPGPVIIDIPKDVQLNSVSPNYSFNAKTYTPDLPGFKIQTTPDQDKINEAITLIKKSKRPLIFSGHGVRIAGAGKEMLEFADRVDAPIASTLHGITAFDTTHPRHLGWMGMHGTVQANRSIENADLLISFGMRFDDRVTGRLDKYAQDADVIHVEIDPSEINKNVRTTVGIQADAKQALQAFLDHPDLKQMKNPDWNKRAHAFADEIGDWHDEELERGTGKSGALLMKSLVTKLSDVTEGKDIVVMDVGQHQMITSKYYKFRTVNSSFNSGGAGTMGTSLPTAIGVKLVRPDETVWSICGDGGFQMNIQELGTVMENDIDIKIVIFNNHYLGMVRQWQTLFFDERYSGTPMTNPDFSHIAKGYGIPYKKVTKIDQAEAAFKKAKKHKGAFILEFECDPSEIVLPMMPPASTFSEMIVNKPE